MTRGQLSDADRKEVVKYRLEKANRTYQEAVGSIKTLIPQHFDLTLFISS